MNSNYNYLKWGMITQMFQILQIITYLNLKIWNYIHEKIAKKNDISIMETNKNNRNTFSRRKMVFFKKIIFHEKKEIINSPIKDIKQNESLISRNNNLFFKKKK